MSNACVFSLVRIAAVIVTAAWVASAQPVLAQAPNGNFEPLGGYSTREASAYAGPAAYGRPEFRTPRGPLARLVENPDQTAGAPPFALTDQTGTIQRYVEPVPGIELAAYVGQVVVVRHDSGPTLLASQLELPPQPLAPMDTGSGQFGSMRAAARNANSARRANLDGGVEQAQYVDNDDSSVQLLPDDVPLPGGGSAGPIAPIPLEAIGPGSEYPTFPGQMGPPEMAGPGFGPECYGPMQYGPGAMQPYPAPMMGMQPCPHCGRFHGGPGFGPNAGESPACDQCEPKRSRFTADVELKLLRPQFSEDVVGKLSEEYQFSPRIILAGRGLGNFDGRVRYWHFGRETNVLGGDDVKLKFDVLDIEATHEFDGRRSQLTLGGGVRLAGIHFTDVNDEEAGGDFIGLTLAGDGLTPLGGFPGGHFGLVYGGRLSILAGDWGGDDNSLFVDEQERSDNLLVHELYAGVELGATLSQSRYPRAAGVRNAELAQRRARRRCRYRIDRLSRPRLPHRRRFLACRASFDWTSCAPSFAKRDTSSGLAARRQWGPLIGR